jgi:hypothetical protein
MNGWKNCKPISWAKWRKWPGRHNNKRSKGIFP